MRCKKKLANFEAAQIWFNRLSEKDKASLTRLSNTNQTTNCAS